MKGYMDSWSDLTASMDLPLLRTSYKSSIIASKKLRSRAIFLLENRSAWLRPRQICSDTLGLPHIYSSCERLWWITICRTWDCVSITTRCLCRNRKLNLLKQTGYQNTEATKLCIEHTTFRYSAWCSPEKIQRSVDRTRDLHPSIAVEKIYKQHIH